jgi:hypothetical protein
VHSLSAALDEHHGRREISPRACNKIFQYPSKKS